MNKHRLAVLTLMAACIAIPGTVWAQSADDELAAAPSLPGPDAVVKILSDKLALTPAQTSSIAPIIAERQQQFRALMADSSASSLERRRKGRQILKDSDLKIDAVLTPVQRDNYAVLEKQMREQLRQRLQH